MNPNLIVFSKQSSEKCVQQKVLSNESIPDQCMVEEIFSRAFKIFLKIYLIVFNFFF